MQMHVCNLVQAEVRNLRTGAQTRQNTWVVNYVHNKRGSLAIACAAHTQFRVKASSMGQHVESATPARTMFGCSTYDMAMPGTHVHTLALHN
jgi:hypothetical protein